MSKWRLEPEWESQIVLPKNVETSVWPTSSGKKVTQDDDSQMQISAKRAHTVAGCDYSSVVFESGVHTFHLMAFLQSSPVCVFELFSAGTSVVSAPQASSFCAPVSSSLSPVDSSSEDSLQRKGKRKHHFTEMTQVPRWPSHPRGNLTLHLVIRGKLFVPVSSA